MTPLITPTINLNGNSAESLVDQLRDVLDALRATQEAFCKANDIHHGRNFQTSPEAWAHAKARDAWDERYQLLRTMEREITDLAIAIQRQGERP